MKHRIFKKTIALLLAICLLPVIRPIHAVTEEDSPLSSASEVQTQSALEPATILNTVSGGGDSFASATMITAGSSATVNLASAAEKRYFKFTPTETGFYTIESSNNTYDPYLWVYTRNQTVLEEVDDIESIDTNFRYTGHFMGGYTYYFAVGSIGSDFGQCTVSVSSTYSLPWTDVLYATTTNANSVNIATEFEMLVYRFIPEESRQYVIQSGGTNGDPYVWLYNSSLDLIDDDDDGSSGLNFRLTATLTAGQTYYITVGHAPGDLGYYGFRILMPANTNVSSENAYLIKNTETKKYVDIHGPVAQELVHQWSFSAGAHIRWKIAQQADGYYTFQSTYGNQYYIGITSTSTNSNNIGLFSTVTDATRWKVYETADGNLLFEPKNAPGKLLYARNNTDGTELQLCWVSQTSDKCVWDIAYSDAFLNYHVPSRTFSIQCEGADALSEPWYSIIEDAAQAWNNSGAGTNISLIEDYSDYTCEIVYKQGVVWVGRTTSYPSNTSTTSAMIEINSAKFDPSFEEPYRNERVGVTVHEIGHLLGLEDEPLVQNPNASIMNYECDFPSIFVPQIFDVENVNFLYS